MASGKDVSARIVLRPGRTPLVDWRAVLGGSAVALDPIARMDVEAGSAALSAIVAGDGAQSSANAKSESASVAELIEARGDVLPKGHIRLFYALKLASLAQGVSGMRWEIVEALADRLANDLLPVVPAGASDRLALSHLFGALTGAGKILARGRIRSATKVLRDFDMRPLALNAHERSALLSGLELSLATALDRLFTAERIFQAAIVAAALSARANGAEARLHLSVHRLHRQRGQFDIATALSALLRSADGDEAPTFEGAGQNADRGAVFRMGAALDLLRQAGAILERAANGVSEDRLVLWQSAEVVPGFNDLTSLALAADLMTLSLSTLGTLSAARIAQSAPSESDPGPAARAASLAARNREAAGTPALDPDGIERVEPMLATTSEIVAIELLEAGRRADEAIDSDGLSAVRRLIRETAPEVGGDGAFADRDIDAVAARVRSGAIAATPGVALPSVAPAQPQRPRAR